MYGVVVFQGSDASSVIFASTPASRKHEFPGALPPSLPLSNGASNSPVPAPTPPNLPVPSPAPAQQPPAHPLAAATATSHKAAATATSMSSPPQPPASVPVVSMPTVPAVTMPQAATAPHPPLPPDSAPGGASHGRTDSPAVATSANAAVQPGGAQYHPSSYHHPHHHHSGKCFADLIQCSTFWNLVKMLLNFPLCQLVSTFFFVAFATTKTAAIQCFLNCLLHIVSFLIKNAIFCFIIISPIKQI